MDIFWCCASDEEELNATTNINEHTVLDISASIIHENKTENSPNFEEENDEEIMQQMITHVELFLPIKYDYYKSFGLYKPIPIRKIPTLENVLNSNSCIKYSDPIPIDHTKSYL